MEKYRPDVVIRLGLLESSSVQWCKTDLNEPNLKVHDGEKSYFIHSQSGAVKEAEELAAKVKNNNTTVLVIYGVGLGYLFDSIKEWLENDYRRKVIFLEDNHAVLHRFLETERATQMILHPQVLVQYVISDNDPWASSSFWSCYDFSLTEYIINYEALPSYQENKPKDTTAMRSLVFYHGFAVPSSMESMNFLSKNIEEGLYENLFACKNAYNFNNLIGKFNQIPAIICGAGSSLIEEIPLLKQCRDRALIFAGGSTVNILSDAGIIPNFCAGGDPTIVHYSRVLMNKISHTPFLFIPRMEYRAVNSLQGDLIASGEVKFDSTLRWFNEQLNSNLVDFSGGYSVSNYCMTAAHLMGCNPIILLGVDLALSKNKKYGEGVKDHPLIMQHRIGKRLGEPNFIMKDVSGNPIVTNYQFIAEGDTIARFAESHKDITVINCSKYGKEIPGIIFSEFHQVASSFMTKSYDLEAWAHSEIHNPAPPIVVQDELIGLLRKWKDSLDKCADAASRAKEILANAIEEKKLSDVDESLLAVEEMAMTEEDAYVHYLSALDKRLTYIMKLWETLWGHKDLRLDETSFDQIVLDNRYGRYNFFHLKAKLIASVVEKIIEKHSEKNDFSPLHIPASEGVGEVNPHMEENYSMTDGELIIEDKELGLNFRESYNPTPVTATFDSENPIRSVLQENEIGLLQGQSVLYYPGGSVQGISYYKDNFLHGPSTYYDTNGRLSSRSWYINGLKQGKEWKYYSSGGLHSLTRYRDGAYQGVQEFFYPDGSRKSILNYSNGLLNGEAIYFHLNGQIKRKQNFVDNMRQGYDRVWDVDGQLIYEVLYAKDVPTGIARSWYSSGKEEMELHLDALGKMLFLKHWDTFGTLVQRKGEDQDMKKGLEQLNQIATSINVITEEIHNKMQQLLWYEKKLGANLADHVPSNLQEEFQNLKKIQEKLKKVK